jgi:hypothetical protein
MCFWLLGFVFISSTLRRILARRQSLESANKSLATTVEKLNASEKVHAVWKRLRASLIQMEAFEECFRKPLPFVSRDSFHRPGQGLSSFSLMRSQLRHNPVGYRV